MFASLVLHTLFFPWFFIVCKRDTRTWLVSAPAQLDMWLTARFSLRDVKSLEIRSNFRFFFNFIFYTFFHVLFFKLQHTRWILTYYQFLWYPLIWKTGFFLFLTFALSQRQKRREISKSVYNKTSVLQKFITRLY